MKNVCGEVLVGVAIAAVFFSVGQRAGAQVLRSSRFLSSEEVGAMLDISARNTFQVDRPDYPLLMKGCRLNFDNKVLSFFFDHPSLWFVQEAAIASLRNYSDANARRTTGTKPLEKSAEDVSSNFFRRVLFDPFNRRYLPKQTAVDLRIGGSDAPKADQPNDLNVLLRFKAEF